MLMHKTSVLERAARQGVLRNLRPPYATNFAPRTAIEWTFERQRAIFKGYRDPAVDFRPDPSEGANTDFTGENSGGRWLGGLGEPRSLKELYPKVTPYTRGTIIQGPGAQDYSGPARPYAAGLLSRRWSSCASPGAGVNAGQETWVPMVHGNMAEGECPVPGAPPVAVAPLNQQPSVLNQPSAASVAAYQQQLRGAAGDPLAAPVWLRPLGTLPSNHALVSPRANPARSSQAALVPSPSGVGTVILPERGMATIVRSEDIAPASPAQGDQAVVGTRGRSPVVQRQRQPPRQAQRDNRDADMRSPLGRPRDRSGRPAEEDDERPAVAGGRRGPSNVGRSPEGDAKAGGGTPKGRADRDEGQKRRLSEVQAVGGVTAAAGAA